MDQRQEAAARILVAYWDGWHAALPALHKRGHWHLVHHLCGEAPAGAPLGELLGVTRQALLVDDATVRDRVQELITDGNCVTDPPGTALSARTILRPTPRLRAGHDASLLSLYAALAAAAPVLQPGLVLPEARTLAPAERALALEAVAVLNGAWLALVDRLADAQGLSQARRLEARRHLLATSHRTLLLLAIARHTESGLAGNGMLADRMAAILLERTGQNFQTTRDHIASLLAFGALERRPGRALAVGLAAGAVRHVDSTLTELADRLAVLVRRAGTPQPGGYALRVQAAGEPALLISVASWPFTIGRTEGNSLRLPAADVSRTHCQLVRQGDAVAITDLDSTNGTEVDGRRIAGTVKLADGAVIRLGPFVLTFLAPEEPADESTVRQRRGATVRVAKQD
ncbi:MAG TPA: FHA domain-containing protein [Acetobacteraceae bacterium]|nr:FHA domain-containing protein [Acetobacteraceae bacterium]